MNRKTSIRSAIAAGVVMVTLFASLLSMPARAGVNQKNGNFYITYADLYINDGGHDLTIDRTYNSKSTTTGWFGKGWGSKFETRLEVQGDGTVIIYENGSGSRTPFYPSQLRKDELEGVVRELVEAAERVGDVRTAAQKTALYQELIHDAERRQARWKKYVGLGEVAPREVKPGSVLRSSSYGGQLLVRTAFGFIREKEDHRTQESFDDQGRYIELNDGTYILYLLRDSRGFPRSVVSSTGKEVHFDMNPDGTVARLWKMEDGKKFETDYDYDRGMLVHSNDTGANAYRYQYDRQFNMTGILYVDGSAMRITYDERGFARYVKNRSGESVLYDYGVLDEARPDFHYYTEVVVRDAGAHEKSRRRTEYHIAERPDGSWYTQRLAIIDNGVRKEWKYNEDGTPVEITSPDATAGFKYNAQGQLIEKISRGERLRIKYNQQGKIREIAKNPVSDPASVYTISYDYDAKANLVSASDSNGEKIRLEYDKESHISDMHSREVSLHFEYNANGKPIRISAGKKGAISVEYDERGEITSVKTEGADGDSRLALTITMQFQRLISLVKPAGINLGL